MIEILHSFFSYETADGTLREEQGEQREIGGEPGTVVHGRYAYRDNGVLYSVTYTSDENGHVAEGAHLPKPNVVEQSIEHIEPIAMIPDERPTEILTEEIVPTLPESDAPITRTLTDHVDHNSGLVRSEHVVNPDGTYFYRFVHYFINFSYTRTIIIE